MALMVGDGPNRGQSAPAPKRRLPRVPADDGPRAETLREGTREKTLPRRNSRTPAKFTAPFWGEIIPALKRAAADDPTKAVRPPALAPRGKQAVQLYNQQQTDTDTRMRQAESVGEMYDNMAARQQKDELRIDREKRDRSEKEKPLTAAQWAKLTPMQQAAAQANADLMAAVAKDFKDQGKHRANSSQKEGGTERVEGYINKVDELFGVNGSVGYKGMEFAPNTLAFLESRGLDKEDLLGKNLDDFVSGDALIDEAAFEALGKKDTGSARDSNIAFAQTLAQGQLKYQEQLAAQLKRGDRLLSDLTSRGTNQSAVETYGANAMPEPKMTEVRPELAGQVDKYMQALARTDIPLNQALDTINMDLADLGASMTERAQIWENMGERAKAATTGAAQWFDGVDFKMRNPDEVAQALGVPALKREGAK